MPVIVKICGLKTPETVDTALEAGADIVGFVFFAPSPRHVEISSAAALVERARGRAEIAVLSVDAADIALDAIVTGLRPDWLQLHGHETPERVAAIRRHFGLRVMKALPVATRADLAAVAQYASVADRLLFDARPPRDATRPGGLGTPFDWHILEQLDPGLPFMLSGGLNAENVAEALRVTHAPGVDVSSGVERAPGEKDPDKIRAFIQAARTAAAAMDTTSRVMSKA